MSDLSLIQDVNCNSTEVMIVINYGFGVQRFVFVETLGARLKLWADPMH